MRRLVTVIAVLSMALAPIGAYAKGGGGGGGYSSGGGSHVSTTTTRTGGSSTKSAPTATKQTTTRTGTSSTHTTTVTHTNTTTRTGTSYPRGVPSGSTRVVVNHTVVYQSPRTGFAGHSYYYGYPYRHYYWNCWACYSQPYWGGYYMAGAYVEPTPFNGTIALATLILLIAGSIYVIRKRSA